MATVQHPFKNPDKKLRLFYQKGIHVSPEEEI